MTNQGRRARGMDHDLYTYWPDDRRAPWPLPNDARIAVFILLYIEHWELNPPSGTYRDPRYQGVYGDFAPDYWRWSYRLYGNRVGIHRVLRVLDQLGIPATVAFNAMAVERYPDLVEAVAERAGWEPVAQGIAATRMITSEMTEEQERRHIIESQDAVARAFGRRPQGWAGQDYGATARTSRLLAEAGFAYTLDWPNDERPYRQLADGRLLAVPTQPDWDDVQALWLRHVPLQSYPGLVAEAADELSDSEPAGRVLCLGLHPWMIGAPHRIAYLRRALSRLQERSDVWFATAGEIAAQYRATCVESI